MSSRITANLWSILFADLRHSFRLWLAAFIIYITIGFAATTLLGLQSSFTYSTLHNQISAQSADGYIGVLSIHAFLTVATTLLVMSVAMKQIAIERSEQLGLFILAGCTPHQITRILITENAVVGGLGAIIGSLLAYATLRPICQWHGWISFGLEALTPHAVTRNIFLGWIICVALCVMGSWVPAHHIAQTNAATHTHGWNDSSIPTTPLPAFMRALITILATVGFLVLVFGTVNAAHHGKQIVDVDSAVVAGMGMTVLAACICAFAGTLWAIPIMRLWTACLQFHPIWALARTAVRYHADRMMAIVTPLSLVIAIPLGIVVPAQTYAANLQAAHLDVDKVHASATGLLAICALPLLLAIAGVMCSILMASKNQRQYLHAVSLAGATPHQCSQLNVCIMTITAITGILEGIICVAFGSWWTACALSPILHHQIISIPWGTVSVVSVIILVCSLAASLIPMLQHSEISGEVSRS